MRVVPDSRDPTLGVKGCPKAMFPSECNGKRVGLMHQTSRYLHGEFKAREKLGGGRGAGNTSMEGSQNKRGLEGDEREGNHGEPETLTDKNSQGRAPETLNTRVLKVSLPHKAPSIPGLTSAVGAEAPSLQAVSSSGGGCCKSRVAPGS